MQLATGIDLVDLKRFQRVIDRHAQRFLSRVYTSQELSEAGGSIASLAVRFAAKEAVAKALGCGIGPVGWQEIEILRGVAREPLLYLHGAAAQRADQLDLHIWALSLSHTQEMAVASVVATGVN